jgi:hypothetical protein
MVMRTTEREVFEALRFLECNPEIVGAPAADFVINIVPFRGRYQIHEDGMEVEDRLGVNSVTDYLHSRLLACSFADRPGAGVLHAALLRRKNRRVLLAGRQAAGKTTLALRLVCAGYDFEGDENVFLESDGIIARPRACRVKEASLAQLPETAQTLSSAPVYVDDLGRKIFNVDPRMVGGSWRIEKGLVDCVIVLQPNHGGYSSLRPMAPMAQAQALISELGMREIGRGASIGAVANLVSTAKGFDLSLGEPESAVRCVGRALDE